MKTLKLPSPRAAAGILMTAVVGTTAVAGWSAAQPTTHDGSAPVPSAAHAGMPIDAQSLSLTQPRSQGMVAHAQTVATRHRCRAVKHSFRPRHARARGVAKNATVLGLHRNPDGSLAMPPLTEQGKQKFAFDLDQGIRPGDPHGHVLFNAHTYPDGSALGNRLLAHLHVGDKIIVRGRYPRQRLCYRVVDRVTVYHDHFRRYYEVTGPPRLAIVVCSGRRLGPGEWESHTVWFAKPIP